MNVIVNAADFQVTPLADRKVSLTPLFNYELSGHSIITSDRIKKHTNDSGSVTFSDVISGFYTVEIVGPYKTTAVSIYASGTGNVYAKDLISASTQVTDSTVAYSQSQSDARYVQQSSTGNYANAFYPRSSNPSGYVTTGQTGAFGSTASDATIVRTSGTQTVSGAKRFTAPLGVNVVTGTGTYNSFASGFLGNGTDEGNFVPSVDWGRRRLYSSAAAQGVSDFADSEAGIVVDWENNLLKDANGICVDWFNRYLYNNAGGVAFDWQSLSMVDAAANNVFNGEARAFYGPWKIQKYDDGIDSQASLTLGEKASRGAFDVNTAITVDDVQGGDVHTTPDAGNLDNGNGFNITVKVYAFRTVGAGRVYSKNPLVLSYDETLVSGPYYVNFAWDSVANADGYRVVLFDNDYNGYNGDYYIDVAPADQFLNYGDGTESSATNDGMTVSPSSIGADFYISSGNGDAYNVSDYYGQNVYLSGQFGVGLNGLAMPSAFSVNPLAFFAYVPTSQSTQEVEVFRMDCGNGYPTFTVGQSVSISGKWQGGYFTYNKDAEQLAVGVHGYSTKSLLARPGALHVPGTLSVTGQATVSGFRVLTTADTGSFKQRVYYDAFLGSTSTGSGLQSKYVPASFTLTGIAIGVETTGTSGTLTANVYQRATNGARTLLTGVTIASGVWHNLYSVNSTVTGRNRLSVDFTGSYAGFSGVSLGFFGTEI